MTLTSASLLPTTPFGAWVVWLGIVIMLTASAWAGWIRILTHTPPAPRQLLRQDSLFAVSVRERSLFLSQVDEVEADAAAGRIDLSEAHLRLAAILRALGTQATRQNLEVATTREIHRALDGVWPDFTHTLSACQEPSFAALSSADLADSLERVRGLIAAATRAADGAPTHPTQPLVTHPRETGVPKPPTSFAPPKEADQ